MDLAPAHLQDLLQVYWDTVPNARFLLCDSATWVQPLTIEQIVATEILPENGYARGNAAPTLDATTDTSNRGARNFQTVTMTATAATITYSGYAIIAGGSASSSQICTATAANNRITSTAHGLTTGDRVLITADGGATLPTGLDGLTAYYASVFDADTFSLLDAPGGAVVTFTSDGSGTLRLRYAAGVVGPIRDVGASRSISAAGDPHTFSPLIERLAG